MHRLAYIAWWTASLLSASSLACRHYENITDIYTEEPPPDASPVARDSGAGRPTPAPIGGDGGNGGSGGSSGAGGSAGSGGSSGSGGGISGPIADASTTPPDGTAVVPPPVDAPPAPPPPDAGPVNSMTLGMGLIGRWRLDERMGTTALDTGGNGNNGVVTGAAWESSGFPAAKYPNGGSLRFDGVDDYVELGTRGLPANNRPQTVSFWFNIAAAPPATGRQCLMSLTAGTMGPSRLKLGFKESRLSAWRSGTPGDLATAAPAATPAPGWHHYAYAFDGTTHRVYLDGAQAAMSTAAAETGAVLRARIGANFDGSERFTGQIDEVRIYNRALMASEVAALNAGFE